MNSIISRGMENTMKLVIITCILLLLVLTGCTGEKSTIVLEVDNKDAESIIIYTYDFSKNSMERHWAYRGEELETIIEYFASLEGEILSEIPSSGYSDIMYGIEINEKDNQDYKMILISNNYAITTNGEYYRIDGDEAEKICTSLKDSLNPLDSIVGVINHRSLSLIENQWRTEFMLLSEFKDETNERIMLTGDEDIINHEIESINFTIINDSDKTISYGARVSLEVEVENIWYQIDDMTIGSREISWDALEYILESGQAEAYNYIIDFYQPLPKGRYRILKEYNFYDEQLSNNYMVWEFEITD